MLPLHCRIQTTGITLIKEQQDKWLQRVEGLFLRLGIKSITMDDVARELGISKKTLYQFVENKDDLVNKMIDHHIRQETTECEQMLETAQNAIEEMFWVIESNRQQLSQMKANIVYDLQKYHRTAWEKMEEYKRGFLYSIVSKNLERGIREGLYRSDFNVDIVTRLHIATSFQLFDEVIFPQKDYAIADVFEEYLTHYLHGIISEKGRNLLITNKKIQNR
jgi:TetR/AcrR family transcriptional regulator, cholesterol catabolism regulator